MVICILAMRLFNFCSMFQLLCDMIQWLCRYNMVEKLVRLLFLLNYINKLKEACLYKTPLEFWFLNYQKSFQFIFSYYNTYIIVFEQCCPDLDIDINDGYLKNRYRKSIFYNDFVENHHWCWAFYDNYLGTIIEISFSMTVLWKTIIDVELFMTILWKLS